MTTFTERDILLALKDNKTFTTMLSEEIGEMGYKVKEYEDKLTDLGLSVKEISWSDIGEAAVENLLNTPMGRGELD